MELIGFIEFSYQNFRNVVVSTYKHRVLISIKKIKKHFIKIMAKSYRKYLKRENPNIFQNTLYITFLYIFFLFYLFLFYFMKKPHHLQELKLYQYILDMERFFKRFFHYYFIF